MPTSAALLGTADDNIGDSGGGGSTATHHLAHPLAHHPHHQLKFNNSSGGENQTSSSPSSSQGGGGGISATLNDLALLSAVAAQNSAIDMIPSCAACDLKINDLYYLVAVGKAWHLHCLRCTACQESLDEGSCFWKAGNIYCREDYQRLFCRCAGCGDEIGSHDLIMSVVDSGEIDGRVSCMLFHLRCFQCALCHRTLERGAKFFTQGANIYCEQHFDICTSSSPLILPMAPLSTNDFGSATSYAFGADMDCDIKPTVGKRAAKTSTKPRKNAAKNQQQQQQQPSLPISPLQQAVPLSSSSPHNNALIKSSPVEVSSLLTSSSNNDLLANVPTSSFVNNKSRTPPPPHSQQQHPPPLIHRHTHQGLLSTVPSHHLVTLPTVRPELVGDIGGFVDSTNNVDYFGAGNEFNDTPPNNNQVLPLSGGSQQSSGGPNNTGGAGQQQRGKRIRTSFKHTQLKIMKHYFLENHNPDAKDLKQLAVKTGLSKRVLQVWFQNARAKFRRTLLKEQQKQGGTAGVSMLPGNPVGFLGGNSSMSDRAQSTSLIDGDSPLSNNSGGHEGMTGVSSASMTIGGEDELDMDDELDDGFDEDNELESSSDRRSRNGKSPASGSGHHLSPPSHPLSGIPFCAGPVERQQPIVNSANNNNNNNGSNAAANANYLFMESAASTLYSTPPNTVDFGGLGQIIQPSML